ncbi:MAG: insulinase family protein [Eubacteriales bacterium]|nr:insulinase family protein [Eubacteriales bacterium]
MNYIRTEICPGVKLTCVNSDKHKTDVMFINFILPLTAVGATSLTLLSKVLVRGTASYPDFRALATACEDNYSCGIDVFTVKKGETLTLSFSVSCLKNKYALNGEDIFTQSLRILGEIIFSPYMPGGCFFNDYVNREKDAMREQILSLANNKPAYAMRRAISLMCGNEPYAIPAYGDLDTLEKLDNERLTQIFKTVTASSPVEIIFTGDYEIAPLIEKINYCLPFSQRKYALPGVLVAEKAAEIKTYTEKADASQSTLVLGFRTGGKPAEEDFTAFTVFNEIYAQSPISKLYMNVRERLSLCYYCNSLSDRLKGIMTVSAGIDGNTYAKAKKAILKELEAVKKGNITDNEYKSAVRSAVSAYREIDDLPGQICSYYFSRIIQGGIFTPEEEIERLNALTVEQVVNTANNITLDTVFLLEGMLE